LPFQNRAEIALRLRRVRLQLDRAPEPGGSLLEIAFGQRLPSCPDIEVRVLAAIGGGDKVAALLQRRGRLVAAAGAPPGEAELVMRFAVLRLEARGLL